MDGKALLEPMYWLSLNPGPLSQAWTVGFIVLFCLGIIAALGISVALRLKAKQWDKPMKRLLRRIRFYAATCGALGLIWLGSAYEMIPLFSARFWFVLWCVGVLYAVTQSMRAMQTDVIFARNRDRERTEKEKYLFGKKK